MACDGLSALTQTTVSKTEFKVIGKHFDLISITCDLLTNTNLKIIPIHINGNQVNLNRPLTFLEQLNCQMDEMAKHIALGKTNDINYASTFYPKSLGYGTIIHNNSIITTKLQSSLYNNILYKEMYQHLAPKLNISLPVLTSEVHWSSFKVARKESPMAIQSFITKWLSEDTATGRVMVRRNQRQHSFFPRCQASDEHLIHILT